MSNNEIRLTLEQIQGIKDHEAKQKALIELIKQKYENVKPIKKKK